ncbi:MAG: efflux RND transporter periplasmic adaptor subunit [Planctomycetaceae bacterium]|nr:efflux RND transporter periplasmic adaptor subunit [Planctomycetaceae bacterium]
MKTRSPLAIGRLVAMILVTGFALSVMWVTGTKSGKNAETEVDPLTARTALGAAAPVVVLDLKPESIEILDTYSGMIRPFERYSMAFEISGRVKDLGRNASGERLDDGDTVRKGQVLAVLDKDILQARVQERTALMEQAQEDLARAKQLRNRENRVISEADFRKRVTDMAVAEAQTATAQKNLENATLIAPCNGRISQRFVSEGESINMHAPALEIVEVDRVLLVVGVPESRIHEIESERQRLQKSDAQDDALFKAYVQLMGTDRYGAPWPKRVGQVFRIGETADDKTGLFEVEILLENKDGGLRPGSVALAQIVIDSITGYQVPIQSVLFRGDQPYVYSVHQSKSDLHYLFFNLGEEADHQANRVSIERYIEQGGLLIVPDMPADDRTIVVKGQHRLVQNRRVRIVGTENKPKTPTISSPNQAASLD